MAQGSRHARDREAAMRVRRGLAAATVATLLSSGGLLYLANRADEASSTSDPAVVIGVVDDDRLFDDDDLGLDAPVPAVRVVPDRPPLTRSGAS